MENKKTGVRKGAWTEEEDTLLRNCIHKFGEGKWQKVPSRAGLNRCRKSCRLRWLNYLRPNLKRGYFTKDEIDLIQRLHKLLGNRWSLIAGRLPGRTANDVKNFWNSHISRKIQKKNTEKTHVETKTSIEKSITIKPRPWTFSKSQEAVWLNEIVNKTNEITNDEHDVNNKPSSSLTLMSQDDGRNKSIEVPHVTNDVPFSLSEEEVDECIQWWLETTALRDEPTPAASFDADVWDLSIFD